MSCGWCHVSPSLLVSQDTLERHLVPLPLAIRLLKQWFPSGRNCPGVSYWEKGKAEAWCQAEGELVCQEGTAHSSDICQTTMQDTEAEMVIVQWWTGPHLGQDCLIMHSYVPLLKTKPHVRTLKTDLGVCDQTSLFLFPAWAQ